MRIQDTHSMQMRLSKRSVASFVRTDTYNVYKYNNRQIHMESRSQLKTRFSLCKYQYLLPQGEIYPTIYALLTAQR